MPGWLIACVRFIDALNYRVGRIAMYLLYVLGAVLLASTVSRIVTGVQLNWALEMSQFILSAYYLLGGAYAWQQGAHVRMDLFYQNFSPRRRALTDALTVVCVIIYLAVVFAGGISSTNYAIASYSGPALAEHVIKNSIDWFNTAANGEMVIELYTADQLVPQGEIIRAVQSGTIDAAQTDDDSGSAPVDVKVFAAYFPFASRYSLDVPALWEWYGLRQIWEEAYGELQGVTWLSTGAWDPCNFGTTKPIRTLEDLKGLRVYTFPTAGQFLARLGVVPVTVPYEDVIPALQTGELDGVCWCGITEMHTVGWAEALKYYLTNPISGAWAGSYFVNSDKWAALPPHLQQLYKMMIDSSHYYRQHWYWAGEARYRIGGTLELTTIAPDEWKQVEDAARVLWDEVAAQSPRDARVIEILKKYNDDMVKAGAPYRYG